MTKKKIASVVLISVVIGYVLGYSLGATKVLLMQNAGDGRSAYVRVCDVDGEFRDENDNCRNFDRVKVSLGRATQISGRRWGNWGVAFGFFYLAGFAISNYMHDKKRKEK